MSGTFRPHGTWTALTTPFSTDRQVDYDSLRRLIEFQVQEGVDGVLPCGTTGESPTLSWQEQDAVIDATVRAVEGRTGVLAGAGSNNTQEAIRASTQAREAGATAVLLVDCYYNGPSSLELRTEYYERILENVPDIPVVPYVIPGRSGCALSAADLAILHLNDPKRVPAVKQATGDLERMRLDRQLAGPALSILSGDDELTLSMMRDEDIRACGVISVLSNIAPGAIGQMVRAQVSGDTEETQRLAQALTDKFRNPVPVKTMMAGLGMIDSTKRPPLGRMSPTAVAQCREALREVHGADPGILGPIEEAFDVRIDQRLGDDAKWSALAR
ncbi:MAG: 4-hydroxy-tetrahydrodipicolinate synthase [Deltaproteobacteria bacterium]|nr:4-hydroxy-tetrahydrodipicolinate synthase [Deltaproteobacteria bacterium]